MLSKEKLLWFDEADLFLWAHYEGFWGEVKFWTAATFYFLLFGWSKND
jgi:hypothetical protein